MSLHPLALPLMMTRPSPIDSPFFLPGMVSCHLLVVILFDILLFSTQKVNFDRAAPINVTPSDIGVHSNDPSCAVSRTSINTPLSLVMSRPQNHVTVVLTQYSNDSHLCGIRVVEEIHDLPSFITVGVRVAEDAESVSAAATIILQISTNSNTVSNNVLPHMQYCPLCVWITHCLCTTQKAAVK